MGKEAKYTNKKYVKLDPTDAEARQKVANVRVSFSHMLSTYVIIQFMLTPCQCRCWSTTLCAIKYITEPLQKTLTQAVSSTFFSEFISLLNTLHIQVTQQSTQCRRINYSYSTFLNIARRDSNKKQNIGRDRLIVREIECEDVQLHQNSSGVADYA